MASDVDSDECGPCLGVRDGFAAIDYSHPDQRPDDRSRNMVRLPGGWFDVGCSAAVLDERSRVDGFLIDRHCVSNERFAAFVRATGHVTDAERAGGSVVFVGLLPGLLAPAARDTDSPLWQEVAGADWRHPEGPASSLAGRSDHPAVHVSWNDAHAYCAWAGLRLPTETEWEYAALGGTSAHRPPPGHRLCPSGLHDMQVLRGTVPVHAGGGPSGTVPVHSHPPNGYGLYLMTGNVWEWVADHPGDRPRVPRVGQTPGEDRRVLRGGSYLCHASYCYRYHVPGRRCDDASASAGNVGFRCVGDLG